MTISPGDYEPILTLSKWIEQINKDLPKPSQAVEKQSVSNNTFWTEKRTIRSQLIALAITAVNQRSGPESGCSDVLRPKGSGIHKHTSPMWTMSLMETVL